MASALRSGRRGRVFESPLPDNFFIRNMYKADDFSRLEIRLDACRNNYNYYRSLLNPSTKLLVLVKANAYGHGAPVFAKVMEEQGADYLAVAYPIEGIELRNAGIHLPILVLSGGTDYFNEMIDFRLEPAIPNMYTLKCLLKVLKKRGESGYPVHIKLDTGMHRLGFMSSEIQELINFLPTCPEVKVKSIYSHLATADDPSLDQFTLAQIEMFQKNAPKITEALGYKPLYHILNSAGIERFSEYQMDMVRLGIGIYGLSPFSADKLQPAAYFKCKILQIKTLKEGDGAIGYCRNGKIAKAGTVIATIPVGYADGIDRRLGNGNFSFELNGHSVPTIGNICMDMCMLDITGVDAKVGDTVTIFGDKPSAADIAATLGTIPYEIFTSVPRRTERIVVE